MAGVTVRRLDGFDDPSFDRAAWNGLLTASASDVVFLTWEYLRSWWESFDRAGLMLLLAERDGVPVALAPLFVEEGIAYFVGSGGSDYLDFLGDARDPDVVAALLESAAGLAPELSAFRLYHVPEESPSARALRVATQRLGWSCECEDGLPAPALDLAARADAGRAAWERTSMVRHERLLLRDGPLGVRHMRTGAEIAPHLDAFFEQHEARWRGTPYPSLFLDRRQREFYRRLTMRATDATGLRFTRVDWNDRPIAFHFGFSYAGRFLWYKPSFDITLARRSPGEVMLRHLLLAAASEGARVFDFGLGDEPFKARFATRVARVRNWTLGPEATTRAVAMAAAEVGGR